MDLEAIRLFSIVAKEGSLQAAARTGNASRTTIRRKLEELEEYVGAPLLVRHNNGVTLTEAGDVLARKSEALIKQLGLVVETAREVALDPPRPIRMLIPLGAPPKIHQRVVEGLQWIFPDACVIIHADALAGANGCIDYDVCVSLLHEIPDGPYEVYEVLTLESILYTSPAYLQSSPPLETIEDLANHPLLLWVHEGEDVPQTLRTSGGGEVPIEPEFVSNDIHVVHELVRAGKGIGYSVHRTFDDEDEEAFVRVLPEVVPDRRPLRVLIADAVSESPKVKRLAEFVMMYTNPE